MSAQSLDGPLRDETPDSARLQVPRPGPDLEVDRDPGTMLDPSWTPERGRSHVAALAGFAEERPAGIPEAER